MENKCVICFKVLDSLCDSQFISFCKSCKLTILKDGEIAVKKSKIDCLIDIAKNKGPFADEEDDEKAIDDFYSYQRKIIEMLEDLKGN